MLSLKPKPKRNSIYGKITAKINNDWDKSPTSTKTILLADAPKDLPETERLIQDSSSKPSIITEINNLKNLNIGFFDQV